MKARQFHFVWAVVICLTVVTISFLPGGQSTPKISRNDLIRTEPFPESPVVVIGTSLMMYAVPPTGTENDSLLSDGRSHVRLALSSITEKETLTMLGRVLNSQAECVFVEIQPFCIDFNFQTPNDEFFVRTLLHSVVNQIGTFSRDAKRDLGRRTGWRSAMNPQSREKRILIHEPTKIDAKFHVSSESLRMTYPLHLRSPRESDRLRNLLAQAREQHTEVVLIAPPRSQTAVNYIGNDFAESLERHFQNLARQLDLPLFKPARSWPDEFFIDQAHMNRRGRERFCRELAKWSSARS